MPLWHILGLSALSPNSTVRILKSSVLPKTYSSFPLWSNIPPSLTCDFHWSFLHSYSFAFLESWINGITVCNLLRLTSFTQLNAFEIHQCYCVSIFLSFLFLGIIPLYGYAAFCLFNHLLKVIYVIFWLGAVMNNAAINTFVQRFYVNISFHFLGQIFRSKIAGSYK